VSNDIGHYRVKQKLGSGGMGEVYLAEDTKLRRLVALKVMPPEVAADPQRRSRFLQEARAASVLNHPHVSTIFEVGEADDTIFIAMEYIEGKTLAQIRESRAVETDEVVDIAIQITDALDEAEARGIIHRDIKSANVMLTARGHVKVLDFGLAKLSGDGTDADEDTRIKTTPGLVVGTASYMSPEQALGRPVDHRSDLFSLGIVLYELTTGRLPFIGTTSTDTIEKITHAQPDPIARFNYTVPAELERIIRKLLEKDPARRYQSARELAVDLKNLKRDTSSGEKAVVVPREPRRRRFALIAAAGVLAISIGAVVAMQAARRGGHAQESTAIESIAVMPFVNTSRDPNTEYLSDGISESIINNLSSIPKLRVTPRSTVFRYKGKDTDLQQIAKELGVRAIVAGRVLQRGDTLAVQTELIDAVTNAQIWGSRYERKVADALALQEEISNEIAARLRKNGGDASYATRAPTGNAEAYQLYLKGRYYWNKRTGESLQKGLGFFEEAAAKDPQFALAYVGIADSYILLEQYADRSATESAAKAEEAARRAIAIDDRMAEAHTTLAMVHKLRWQWGAAETEFKRAIAINPNYPTARHWYNIMLRENGRVDEAYAQILKAQELDPLSMIIGVNVVAVLEMMGRNDDALAMAQRYMEIDDDYPQMLGMVARLQSLKGRHAEALVTARKAVELSGGVAEQLGTLAEVHAAAGDRAAAAEVLARLEAKIARGAGDPYFAAQVYAALNDRKRAFGALARSVDQGSGMVSGLKTEPRFAPMRSDPRFAALLRKIGT
jgi:serine/threonine-protein kinase